MCLWKNEKISKYIEINPKETLHKGTLAKKIGMDKLKPFCRDVSEYEVTEYSGGVKFRNGDTIMARITPCLENGKTAMVNILEENEVGFGSTEYIVFRAKKGIADEDFVFYLVLSPIVRDTAIKSMVGSSGRQRVQIGVIQDMEVPFPDLNIQRKIASILKNIDDKIMINSRINNNLEQQAKAIFKSWFIDLEPFDKKMPSDWKIGTIHDLAKDVICGKTPSTKKSEYYGFEIPFITIPDMHGKTYIVTTERYLSKLGASLQPKKSLPKNSVCVSCIGTAGLVSLVSEESQTNQQINSIIPKDDFSPYYIYLLMQTLSNTINKLGQSGSTIVNLNKSQFGKIQVTIPTLSVMLKFDEIISPLFKKILQNQKENLKLISLRDSLLPKLLSGELDVSNIDL
ncbi:restriction endonuclease subunit S [Eubacterium ventriosum]|uniref:restriction endonuclease subunit S n=2 Tax=Eubacterium ventriosum TaxID=39496 RepID=UPI001FAB0ED4|nr:restriction endonuclease subunit S [Eubacterium ventriosum]